MKQAVIQHLVDSLGLDQAEIPEFYASFMQSFDDCAAGLGGISSPSDFAGIRAITHSLFGFSQNVGALDLYEIARTLNTLAKAEDATGCAASIKALLELHDAYKAER